ncbi:MAG: amino acid--tRNA ligase-related protein, partial [Candidatus Beckwithbacteria bacterium]
KISASLNAGARENYEKSGLMYVDVPEIVGITGACENVDTLFKVGNRLDIPLFFTQTGQLSLEQALQSFNGTFTVIHSGRDEEKEDERHLRQFRLTEEEFDCTLAGMSRKNYDEEKMFEALLSHIQKAIQGMIKAVLRDNASVLKKVYQRDVTKLEQAAKVNFLRINYEDVVKLLNKQGFNKLKFGDDLKADHEQKVVELLNKNKGELPVFIMRYPKEIKFFNMKVSTKDPRVVLSADLILPYSGESTGSAVREHDFKKLSNRLLTSTMYKLHLQRGGTIKDFGWYLKIIKSQTTNPHAGYGIGNERVLQYIFKEKDIRNVSLFSLLNRQSQDWHVKHYGQAAVYSGSKKQLLLTIGKLADKKKLLPFIAKLNNNFTLYATEKTHEFLQAKGVKTARVYKISQIGQRPNIGDLLRRRIFDLVINIPQGKTKELTDGKLIRRASAEAGVSLITDMKMAKMVLENLCKH